MSNGMDEAIQTIGHQTVLCSADANPNPGLERLDYQIPERHKPLLSSGPLIIHGIPSLRNASLPTLRDILQGTVLSNEPDKGRSSKA